MSLPCTLSFLSYLLYSPAEEKRQKEIFKKKKEASYIQSPARSLWFKADIRQQNVT